ncbi:MAG TPA: hypothetical protein VEC06_10775 [Paucimonas sp.]|nr:hypothetical protein [Paucimonas sp.]
MVGGTVIYFMARPFRGNARGTSASSKSGDEAFSPFYRQGNLAARRSSAAPRLPGEGLIRLTSEIEFVGFPNLIESTPSTMAPLVFLNIYT